MNIPRLMVVVDVINSILRSDWHPSFSATSFDNLGCTNKCLRPRAGAVVGVVVDDDETELVEAADAVVVAAAMTLLAIQGASLNTTEGAKCNTASDVGT